jgi:hypothetical protein
MFANKIKSELIGELCGAQKDHVCQNLFKLLDILISEARIENDTAEENVIYRNQGKIQGFLELKDSIERGLPAQAGFINK